MLFFGGKIVSRKILANLNSYFEKFILTKGLVMAVGLENTGLHQVYSSVFKEIPFRDHLNFQIPKIELKYSTNRNC